MRYIIGIFSLLLILYSCKASKEIVYEQKRDSVYVQKLIPVSLPADSSIVKALLQCDASGSVLLSRLSIETTRNARLSLLLDSLGNLQIETIVKLDTLYLPSDSIRIETVLTEFVEVEKKLSKWDSFILRFGNWIFGGLCCLLLFFIIRFIIRLKK